MHVHEKMMGIFGVLIFYPPVKNLDIGEWGRRETRLKGPSKYREEYKFTTGMFHLELQVHLGNSNFFNHTSISGTEHGIFAWSHDRPLPIPQNASFSQVSHIFDLPSTHLHNSSRATHKITLQHHHHEGWFVTRWSKSLVLQKLRQPNTTISRHYPSWWLSQKPQFFSLPSPSSSNPPTTPSTTKMAEKIRHRLAVSGASLRPFL